MQACTMSKGVAPYLLLLLTATTLLIPSAGIDTLIPGRQLADGETLVSGNQTFVLGFFSPQGSKNRYVGIWYHDSMVSVQTIVWVANRDRPISEGLGNLSIAANGTLYVSAGNNSSFNISFSSSPGPRSPVAQLLDNGNFIVREATGSSDDSSSFAWQSFYYPTDTVLPGMKTGWFPKLGIHTRLVAWKSASDPASSEHYGYLDTHGYPQQLFWTGPRLIWRSGPWNGLRYSGIPEMTTFNMFSFQFVVKPDEIFYEFDTKVTTIISKLTLNQSGDIERLVWVPQYKTWNSFWSAPKDECDKPSKCGSNGVCDAESYPVCDCIPGFRPKDPATWALRDGSAGCVRNTSLDCRTDGFMVLRGTKLPDTSRSTVDMSLSMAQCHEMCLSNCSCTAYANANISSGIGCLIWIEDLHDLRVYSNGGQDLFVRLAAVDLARIEAGNKSHKKELAIIVGSLGTGAVVFVIVIAYFVLRKLQWCAKRSRIEMIPSFSSTTRGAGRTEDDNVELPLFGFETISAATDEFSSCNMLGEGGFGFVYRGKLAEGQEIAVKRLSKTSIQGVNEFMNEVTLIAKLQHRNLVRLLGCCIEGEERMLVYEYMPNKSLDAFLFEKDHGCHLSWEKRYDIILGIARGLLYLHQDSRFRIIHRDLKASNILLDRDMNPKISDFGLARIFSNDDAMNKTKRVMGTFGYMSPEYALNGVFSVKSDVFSFGVLVLEIISGERNKGVYHSNPQDYLLGKTWSLWNEGRCLELIDPSMDDGRCSSVALAEVDRCIKVGLLCVQEFPMDRPTMSSVVLMLSSDNMTMPEPKQPGFVAKGECSGSGGGGGCSHADSSPSSGKLESVKYLTITMNVGR